MPVYTVAVVIVIGVASCGRLYAKVVGNAVKSKALRPLLPTAIMVRPPRFSVLHAGLR